MAKKKVPWSIIVGILLIVLGVASIPIITTLVDIDNRTVMTIMAPMIYCITAGITLMMSVNLFKRAKAMNEVKPATT